MWSLASEALDTTHIARCVELLLLCDLATLLCDLACSFNKSQHNNNPMES